MKETKSKSREIDMFNKYWQYGLLWFFYTEHDALQPLDIQSLNSELCAFGYCCTEYAVEKLQSPKMRYTLST